MKVTVCKHSASCTTFEQAADCSPMLKLMKRLVTEKDIPHTGFDNLLHFIEAKIDSLVQPPPSIPNNILKFSTHKKKAILATIPKFPIATGCAFTIDNVKKGFTIKRQLHMESKLVPSL